MKTSDVQYSGILDTQDVDKLKLCEFYTVNNNIIYYILFWGYKMYICYSSLFFSTSSLMRNSNMKFVVVKLSYVSFFSQ